MNDIQKIEWKGRTLYSRGNTDLLRFPSIAFVGTRGPSENGKKAGYSMVRKAFELSGRAVVSGLALGCDTIAHRAALDAGAPTIAVLPCAIDIVKPFASRQLACEILESGGLIISEYPPGTPVSKWMFVKRDSLIAGITDAVIVIEKGTGNGTMHTVQEALKREKPVGYWRLEPETAGSFAGMKVTGIADAEELKGFLERI